MKGITDMLGGMSGVNLAELPAAIAQAKQALAAIQVVVPQAKALIGRLENHMNFIEQRQTELARMGEQILNQQTQILDMLRPKSQVLTTPKMLSDLGEAYGRSHDYGDPASAAD